MNLPEEQEIILITKSDLESSDSFLAQGGICVLRDEKDYYSYFEDTMKAGHYENRKESVDIMIRNSRDIINDLVKYGVEFEKKDGKFAYTREGAHSRPRILFHEDVTGKEITSTLLDNALKRKNITIKEHIKMMDIICDEKTNECYGLIVKNADGDIDVIKAKYTVFACGGLGGLYKHSTNFRHITGDALAIALKHGIEMEHIDYIQIHPTTLYSEKPGRRFLISESVRGEGAILLDKNKKRFCDELRPRDIVTADIHRQMEKDGTPFVWLSMERIPEETIRSHFPNIMKQCLEEGYDPTKECIPVVPAQHYFMGGIKVNLSSMTSMERLYAVGETSCNGVHGKNRLASNSLLESMVFADRAADEIQEKMKAADESRFSKKADSNISDIDMSLYDDDEKITAEYKELVLNEIDKEKSRHE